MLQKRIICHIIVSSDFGLSCETPLLPKNRDGPSDLQVRAEVFVVKNQHFSFAKVRHVPIVIDAAGVVSSTSTFARSAGYKVKIKLFLVYDAGESTEKSLFLKKKLN